MNQPANIAVNNMERRRRSEDLLPEELEKFQAWYSAFKTKTEAESDSGISRQNLDNLNLKGSASPETIDKIRQHLKLGKYAEASNMPNA